MLNKVNNLYDNHEFNDSHYHLTNYIQEGPHIRHHLKLMGDKVGRCAVFGMPLHQTWSYMISGNDAPKYYLDSDAPLYYYSYTDAYIAMQFLSLTDEEKLRFDPLINGFNCVDMYAVEHIKRVLKNFPGVFTGIGEFTIHKEFVSSKIEGEIASLYNPALDCILKFAGETGLLVLLHNDINKPFPRAHTKNYVEEINEVFKKHSSAVIIWAHIGLGRVVRPLAHQIEILKTMLEEPNLSHVYFDLSWVEVAKYIAGNDKTARGMANLINAFPDRFLFGTDEMAVTEQKKYLKIYYMYEPLWKRLTPDACEKVKKANYIRLFDNAKMKVRKWEKENIK